MANMKKLRNAAINFGKNYPRRKAYRCQALDAIKQGIALFQEPNLAASKFLPSTALADRWEKIGEFFVRVL